MDMFASPVSTGTQKSTAAAASSETDDRVEVVSTTEIHKWLSSVEFYLNEVCVIATEGKLNTEQKLKISNHCRKVQSSTAHMAVQYQSLKQKTIQAYGKLEELEENSDLVKQISELKQTFQDCNKVKTVSFADMVKKGSNEFVPLSNISSVAIYPSNDLKSSDDTKNLVQKIISPEQMKLQVRSLRKTKNGGVIINTETKEDVDKLKQAVLHSTSGLRTDEPSKRSPRIVVMGVPSSMAENEVFRCIFEQNIDEKCPIISLEHFMLTTQLSHKSGRRGGPTCNYVIEVSPSVRRALILKTRIFINWTSCPVRDFTLVTRCYKCQQYGHAAKTCRESTNTCGHCGETGHSMSECERKTDPPKCATCSRFNKPNSHKTGDPECPARKLAEMRYINSVDYGNK